jgi:hypothetical protein
MTPRFFPAVSILTSDIPRFFSSFDKETRGRVFMSTLYTVKNPDAYAGLGQLSEDHQRFIDERNRAQKLVKVTKQDLTEAIQSGNPDRIFACKIALHNASKERQRYISQARVYPAT